jgi:hypothetical protein
MNWQVMATVAELLAAIGVIVSLIYLASQVRDGAAQTRLMAVQSILGKLNSTFDRLAGDQSAADLWARGLRGMAELRTDAETVRFMATLLGLFRTYEELFQYYKQGSIDDWAWSGLDAGFRDIMATPGFQEWWELRQGWFCTEFAAFIGDALPAPEGGVLEDYARKPRSLESDLQSADQGPDPT